MASKGPDGRSSIARSVKGGWEGWVSMGTDPATGKRLRRHVRAQTKAEVSRKVAQLEAQRAAGQVAGRRWLVRDWVTAWVAAQRRKVRPSTLRGYRPDLARLVGMLGERRMDQVGPADIEALYAAAHDSGLSSGGVAHLHRTVAACFAAAERQGVLGRSPLRQVRAPTAEPPEVVPLSVAEVRQVLAAAAGTRNAARWSVALALGLRQGEALGLCWSDVDLEAGALTVRRQLQWRTWSHGCAGACGRGLAGRCPRRHGGGPVLTSPKSRAGRRSMVLPAPLVAELRAHAAAQVAERDRLGDLWCSEWDLVFPAPGGGPGRPEADRRAWGRLLDEAGVPYRRLHDARHTAATLLLVQGVAPAVAMTLLGHTDLGVTRRYQHVVDELRRDAAERMGEAVWGR